MSVSPVILLDAIRKEKEKRAAENSLHEFTKQAWEVIEPGTPFVDGWHLHAISEHLEAVTKGEIRQLLINMPPRHAIRLGTKIPTTDGFKTIEDIEVGDFVFSPVGNPIPVVGKSEVFTGRDVYRCETDDRAFIDVDAEHLWTVRLTRDAEKYHSYTTEQLFARQNGGYLRTKRNGEVELRVAHERNKDFRLPKLPNTQAVQYAKKNLLVDPYVLGVWLGDGSKTCGTIASHADDAKYIRAEFEKAGIPTTTLAQKNAFGTVGLRAKLAALGILNAKKIPSQYLQASIQQRQALLQGLMDTDGSVSPTGQCSFLQKSTALTAQVLQLLRSLGIKAFHTTRQATCNNKNHGLHNIVTFHAQNVFRLPRKEARTKKSAPKFGRGLRIEKLQERADFQCLEVGTADGLFLAGEGYICTHNCKSIQVAVMWPVWVWISRPEYKWLFASYAGTLSVRDSLKCRRLLESVWFQQRWGHKFKLTGDQNAKTFFETDKYGYRFATSVGASTTGHGGDTLVVDDPHNSMEAQSDVMREGALEWWDQAMSTRLNNPKTGTKVIVMQRLHERDLSGHVLKQGGWEHLCLPAEFDGVTRKTKLGHYDPRKEKEELLWPEHFGRPEVDKLKLALGEYGTAGQLQQRPSPAGGGIIKIDNLKLWPHDQDIPALQYIVQSYDTAFTEKTTGDPSACTVWGVTRYRDQNVAILLDAWSEHLPYHELRARVIDEWASVYGVNTKDPEQYKGRRADLLLVEAKASGQSLLQDLRQANLPARGYNPGKADKITRAHAITPLIDAGLVYVLESKKRPGEHISWAKPVVSQMEKFPADEHDDYVDTVTQALIYFKDTGMLELEAAREEVEEYYNKPIANPYTR